jgi:predicted acetyltransferase
MRLQKASLEPPSGLPHLLEQLGASGENGFIGTGQPTDAKTLAGYLQSLVDMDMGVNLRPQWVPMTTFWLVNHEDEIVGVSRLRHRLTPSLLEDGGHIGYYVQPDYRGRGYGKIILTLTLQEARKLDIERALLTVRHDNTPSIRIIETSGGVMEDERTDPDGVRYRRYWISLT